MLLLLHSACMLSMMKMLLKGEVGGRALNSHGNYIFDHGKSWKCVFEFLWEPCKLFSCSTELSMKFILLIMLKCLQLLAF